MPFNVPIETQTAEVLRHLTSLSPTLAEDDDTLLASQKAIKAYLDFLLGGVGGVIADHSLVRGDGGGLAIQGSSILVDDVDVMTFPAAGLLNMGAIPPNTGHTISVDGSMELDHTAVSSDDHAVEIMADAAGFGDVKALDIDYVTGAIAIGQDEAVILVNIDESAATGGDVVGLEVIATEGSAVIYGMLVGAVVNPIVQLSGVFEDADTINNNGSTITTLNDGGAGNVSVFPTDDDYMLIGNAVQFQEIEYLLDTGASGGGIAPTFQYSTGVDTWTTFSPVDGTNGMRNSGVIVWLDADIPSWAVGTGSEYLIRILRTRNNLGTTPIADKVQITIDTIFSWNKDGDVSVNDLTLAGTAYLAHQTLAQGDISGFGQMWVKDDDPTTLWFTDSDGNDVQLSAPSGSGSVTAAANITNHSLVRGDGGAKGIQGSGILINDTDDVSAINDLDIGGNLTVDPDVDGSHVIGKLRIGLPTSGVADSAYLGHYDNFGDATSFAIRVKNNLTVVNAPTGGQVYLRVNNTTALTATATDITVAGDLDVGGDATLDGDLNVTPTGNTQGYTFTRGITAATTILTIKGDLAGSNADVFLEPLDADGTDSVSLQFVPERNATFSLRDRLIISGVAGDADYEIYTEASGGPTLRNLNIYTEGNDQQLYLTTDGNVSIANDLDVGGDVTVANGNFVGNADEHERIVFASTGGGRLDFYTGDALNMQLSSTGDLHLKEKASGNWVAGYGTIWVKNTTPSELWYTDDAGTATLLA